MKDETKEILEAFKPQDEEFTKAGIKEYPLVLSVKEQKILLDYITNLQEELKLKTDFIEELLTIILVARDYELHDKCYTRSKIYQDKLKALKEGKE